MFILFCSKSLFSQRIFPFVPLCFSPFFDLCLHIPFTIYFLSNASKAVHDVELLPCRVEFDRLTDLLRARTIEPDPPKSIVFREENNEGIRIDAIGGSTSHQMAAESPTVKVRTKPAHTSILCYSQCKVTENSIDSIPGSHESRAKLEEHRTPVQFIILFQYLRG